MNEKRYKVNSDKSMVKGLKKIEYIEKIIKKGNLMSLKEFKSVCYEFLEGNEKS
jgi:hypothetical protein